MCLAGPASESPDTACTLLANIAQISEHLYIHLTI